MITEASARIPPRKDGGFCCFADVFRGWSHDRHEHPARPSAIRRFRIDVPPRDLTGIHLNVPATVPPEIARGLADGGPTPAGLSTQVGTGGHLAV
ncbi:hypothetical protein AB0K15_17495 [Amycolatopsis sp. NPDC049253]|uniref:hypothetical protein n=1 Tax=Amycolatopsis sp. NPDC049253 TaxID=3155274 RepID=UPI003445BBEB